jgi:hypothetical protein
MPRLFVFFEVLAGTLIGLVCYPKRGKKDVGIFYHAPGIALSKDDMSEFFEKVERVREGTELFLCFIAS